MAINDIALIVLRFIVISLILAIPIQFAWNLTLPVLFGLPLINYGQALALKILVSLLVFTPIIMNDAEEGE
jgi:hypothetical protein